MPRKTLLLIIGLVLLAALLVFVAIRMGKNGSNPDTPRATEIINTTAILSFEPRMLQKFSNNQSPLRADVLLNTGGSAVSTAQISLKYDPRILQNVSFTPASSSALFNLGSNASPLLNESDPASGTITYAVAILPESDPVNGTGILGTLEFSVNPQTEVSGTIVAFGQESAVTTLDETKSILKQVIPLQISILQVNAGASASLQ